MTYFVFQFFSEKIYVQLSEATQKGLYKCAQSATESLSKFAKSEVDINQNKTKHKTKLLTTTQMPQTNHLNSTLWKQNTQENFSSHHTVTFEFALLMIILSVLLTSLISVFLTIYALKKQKTKKQFHNSKEYFSENKGTDEVNWEILKQLDTEIDYKTSLNSFCSIGVPSPMQLIEPKIFHSIVSSKSNDIYEVMNPGLRDQSKINNYKVDRNSISSETGM